MVKFNAHQAAATFDLGLQLIGDGADFSAYQYSGPLDDTPDSIQYFHDPAQPVGFVLHGDLSDLATAAQFPYTMTVTAIDATYQGKAAYELTGCSFDIEDYYGNWNDIESIIFAGNDRIFGSRGGDYLYGYGGDDVIKGGKGRDILAGQGGTNTLTGGKGADYFAFSELKAPGLADHVVDYEAGVDHITFFLVPPFDVLRFSPSGDHSLKAGMFHLGKQAADGNDHIIYDRKSGSLWFDEDGDGGLAKSKLAIFDNHPVLSHHDFILVA